LQKIPNVVVFLRRTGQIIKGVEKGGRFSASVRLTTGQDNTGKLQDAAL
jgi:hypothetical protein